LDSVLSQRVNFPWEIIVGEDESTDGTREICIEYAKRYPNLIKLFLRSRKDVIYVNGKPTGRYNMIENIKAARGKYIALLEGDDFWLDPFKLQKQVDFLDANPDCIVCHHWHKYAVRDKPTGEFVVVDAPIKGQGYYNAKKASVEKIFANVMRVKSRTLMFRNILASFPSWFYRVAYGDVALSMILGKYGDFGFIDEPMAVYRQTGQGASAFDPKNHRELYRHLIQWVNIWEFGVRHYDGKYLPEAMRTIESFYKAMFSTSHYDVWIYWKVVSFIVAESCLPISIRIRLLVKLSRLFLRGRIRS
jgi:glycosyltransferase involved in cell wall biosynthesis